MPSEEEATAAGAEVVPPPAAAAVASPRAASSSRSSGDAEFSPAQPAAGGVHRCKFQRMACDLLLECRLLHARFRSENRRGTGQARSGFNWESDARVAASSPADPACLNMMPTDFLSKASRHRLSE